MARNEEFDEYMEEYKDLSYNELNKKAQDLGFKLMSSYPNSWKTVLAKNPAHRVLDTLLRQKRGK